MASPARWWHPDRFQQRSALLQKRGLVKQAVRAFFLSRDFYEVDTPILQVSPGNETHISAFVTNAIAPDGSHQRLFLHSSPEFACKKLLAAGVRRLYTLVPAFRNRERGRLHHPEFLMLEWYRAGASLDALIDDCVSLLREVAAMLGITKFRYGSNEADVFTEAETVTVSEAFRRYAGVDLEGMLPEVTNGFAHLAAAARSLDVRVSADDAWGDIFSKILSVYIEPNLGVGQPTIMMRYPASAAALARLCPDDPRFAERFELYCCGVELANAFAELTDASEQRLRFEAEEAERARIYGETYPIDEEFIDALEIMPEAVGIALGFDRLVMLATAADTIEDVLWMPVARP